MISLPLAAFIFTVLLISIGILHFRMQKLSALTKDLEKTLTDSNRELTSMETLNTEFLNRIGDAFNVPLKAIEQSSRELAIQETNLSPETISNLKNLSDEVRSLIRILNVIEDISSIKESSDSNTSPKMVKIQLDELVSEIAMDMSEIVADKMVSFSLSICGSVIVYGIEEQLSEAISLILKEALKNSTSGSILDVELRAQRNIEFEASWNNTAADSFETEILAAGFIRLIASSHGGWLNIDIENGHITLVLPRKGETK